MIFQQKINSLTEEELYILLYILKKNSGDLFEWHPEYFKTIKPERLSPILDEWTGKMKEENRHKISEIKSKLGC
jgi:succinate dehydrogenase flavin-adding protein (antitoxin of CptAB toxin-antitoxin module)